MPSPRPVRPDISTIAFESLAIAETNTDDVDLARVSVDPLTTATPFTVKVESSFTEESGVT